MHCSRQPLQVAMLRYNNAFSVVHAYLFLAGHVETWSESAVKCCPMLETGRAQAHSLCTDIPLSNKYGSRRSSASAATQH